jgi:hypothetical protein
MEVVKTCKYCPTTFTDPFALEKLSHHLLTVHLNLDPEIFMASPHSTCDWHIPTPAGNSALLGLFGPPGFSDYYIYSKKRKMNPSFSLEQFFLKFPILEEKICNQLDHQSLITFTKASKDMMDITLKCRFYWVRSIEYQLRRVSKGKIPKKERSLEKGDSKKSFRNCQRNFPNDCTILPIFNQEQKWHGQMFSYAYCC